MKKTILFLVVLSISIPVFGETDMELSFTFLQQFDDPYCAFPDSRHIDYFVGMPLIIGVGLVDAAVLQAHNAGLPDPKQTIYEDRDHRWFKRVRLCIRSLDSGTDTVTRINLGEFFGPKLKFIVERLNEPIDGNHFYLPGTSTNKLQPSSYSFWVEIDDSNLKDPGFTTLQLVSERITLNLKEAKSTYERAQVLYHEGYRKFHFENDKSAALELLQESIELSPDFPPPYILVASILYKMGRFSEAKFYAQQLIETINKTKIDYWAQNAERRKCDSLESQEMLDSLSVQSKDTYACPTPIPTPWPQPTPLP